VDRYIGYCIIESNISFATLTFVISLYYMKQSKGYVKNVEDMDALNTWF
jgi:hypothetical protein